MKKQIPAVAMFQLGGFRLASSCGDRDELSRGNTVMDFITVFLVFATRIDNIRSILSYLRSLQITNRNYEVVVEWTTYEASRLLAI